MSSIAPTLRTRRLAFGIGSFLMAVALVLTTPVGVFADYDSGTYGADAYSVENQAGPGAGLTTPGDGKTGSPGDPNTAWGSAIPVIGPVVARVAASTQAQWIVGGIALLVVVAAATLLRRRRAS
ncbi:MAG TPA: hypothetical protein VHZ98_15985 [Galbitalea sp.]|jgi:MYXO-CTERM domain-containing protein|nr:hypothetical protein [Galbitalea sp.]